MLDGDKPKSEEERLEEIKFEIKSLFDSLKLEINDPTLKEQLSQQRKIIVDLLSLADETEELPKEAKEEIGKYFEILKPKVSEAKDQTEYDKKNIQIDIEYSKMFYDSGKIGAAYDLLTNSSDKNAGVIMTAENRADFSEEFKKIYLDIKYLVKLISSLEIK